MFLNTSPTQKVALTSPTLQLLIDRVCSHPVPSAAAGQDKCLWRSGPNDYKTTFISSHTWDQLRTHSPRANWATLIWFPLSVPRFTFIAWLAVHDRLDTGARAAHWGGGCPCSLCGERIETRDHLFFACPFASVVWLQVGGRILGRTTSPDWIYIQAGMLNNRLSKQDNNLLRLTFQTSVYHIWRERNDRNHGTRPSTSANVTQRVKRAVRDRILSKKHGAEDETMSLLHRWDTLTH